MVLVIIISVAHIDAVPDNVVEIVDKVYLGYMAFLDILLSLMFFKYGRLLHYSKRAHKTQLLPRTPQTFYILNNSLVFLFLIRGAYQILNAIELLPDEQSRIDVNGDHDPMFWGIFTLYAVTEIVPTLSLVVLIWTVPQRQAKSIDTVDIKRLGFFRRMLGAKGGEGSKDNLMNYAEVSKQNKFLLAKPKANRHQFFEIGKKVQARYIPRPVFHPFINTLCLSFLFSFVMRLFFSAAGAGEQHNNYQ